MKHEDEQGKTYHTCDWCDAEPIDFVVTKAFTVELCLKHVKLFTRWSTEDWELKHAPLADHLSLSLPYMEERGGIVTVVEGEKPRR